MEIKSKTTKGLEYRDARDYRRGFTNGLTNGLTNGFVNGNRQRLARKKEEKKHGKILAFFLLALLVLSVVAVLAWQSGSANAIRIDGNFDDWQGVAKTTKPRNENVPENIDIAEYATAEAGKNVAFYAKVYGKLLEGDGRYIVEAPSDNPVYVAQERETAIPNANGRDVAYVFIDVDSNPETGFKPSQNFAVGADKAIEIAGKNGKIETSRVLSFAGVVQQEWTWNIGESVAAATNGKELETMAGKNILGIGEKYAVYFYMIDWQNKECKVENALRCENAKATAFGLYLNAEAKKESMSMEVRQGTAHAPIHINGDPDFANQATNESWQGNGTQENPYIIENYTIDAQGGSYAIWIENTTAYFVIMNCHVHQATNTGTAPYGCGIALTNVQNGNILNNTANNSHYALYVNSSTNLNIVNNNASNNYGTGLWAYGYGIYLTGSDNNTITNNNVSNNYGSAYSYGNAYGYGIYLTGSNNNTITNNNASNNYGSGGYGSYAYGYGIYLTGSDNNTITNNNASGNYGSGGYGGSGYGIYQTSSNNNTITNNNASNNYGSGFSADGYGIYLTGSNTNTIMYNWFTNNKKEGAYITGSSTGNIVHHNNFIGNNGASKGVIGNCQAYDSVGGNSWYDNTVHEGNYWSNWDGNGHGSASAYPIAGGAGASDYYPLSGAVPEFSGLPVVLLVFAVFLVFILFRRQK